LPCRSASQPKIQPLNPVLTHQVAEEFLAFISRYKSCFVSYRHDVSIPATQYCCGLMQSKSDHKNMERMAEVVVDAKDRNLQQFLTHSKWDASALFQQVARDADQLLGDSQQAVLIIDEVGFPKQGKESVGVARQYLGCLGKVDNGQVGVFAVLCKGQQVLPVGVRLYLPEEWVKNPQACQKAGIPEKDRVFKTKPQLALELILEAQKFGVRFHVVRADAGYGSSLDYLRQIHDQAGCFMIDLHTKFLLYKAHPHPCLLPQKPGRGRPSKNYTSTQKNCHAIELINQVPEHQWKTLDVRPSTRGALRLKVCRVQVFAWDPQSQRVDQWTLLASKDAQTGADLKISLTNAGGNTPLLELFKRQRARYWVERFFEDAKGCCGMGDYQVRKWNAWHHHMALVGLSMLFIQQQRQGLQKKTPLLPCADVVDLLFEFLPKKKATPLQVCQRIYQRHQKRLQAIQSHARRQKRSSDQIAKDQADQPAADGNSTRRKNRP